MGPHRPVRRIRARPRPDVPGGSRPDPRGPAPLHATGASSWSSTTSAPTTCSAGSAPAMSAHLTDDGWQFHDPSRTTAEIILDLLSRIREAAGDLVLIGCNTVGHLARRAGRRPAHRRRHLRPRLGADPEDGRQLARLPAAATQPVLHRRCRLRARTPQTPWELNRQFLDLIARSGSALFVSVDPAARTAQTDRDLGHGIRLALSGGDAAEGGIEPLDWLVNTTPDIWRAGDGTVHYDVVTTVGRRPSCG